MSSPSIIVTQQDLERLHQLIHDGNAPALAELEAELSRAEVVASEAIPSDVVTMNSDVTFIDVATGNERTVRLVYPGQADADKGWISILAPIGIALLGLRKGQEIDWSTPGGQRRIRVHELHYQPERSGHFNL